jgi:hypothetical protein
MKTDIRRSSEKELHQAATSWEHLRQGQLVILQRNRKYN